MKLLRIYLIAASLFTFKASAQTVNIKFDFSNAKETLRLLEKGNLTDQEINDFVNLPSTKAMIKKVNSSTDSAAFAIKNAALGKPLSKDLRFRFQYDWIKKDLVNLKNFINEFESKTDSISKALTVEFKEFLPQQKNIDIKTIVVLGSFSSGWATNESNIFYIDLHFPPYDIKNVANTCKHELFHIIQANVYPNNQQTKNKIDSLKDGKDMAYFILSPLFREGTAEFFADTKKIITISPAAKKSYEHMAVNQNRGNGIFYLFEEMLINLYNQEKYNREKYLSTYSILFDWNWNNPGYYMGKVMTSELTAAYGNDYLAKSLNKGPLSFVKDYINLSKTAQTKVSYTFSKEFENIIDELTKSIN